MNHMRSHTNDTPFRCDLCGKSFTRKEHFTNHILWHTGQYTQFRLAKRLIYKLYKNGFIYSILDRVWYQSGLEFSVFKYFLTTTCYMFSKCFLAFLAGETPHRCDFCSKTFTRKEHLLNHVRQHTGESPHRCTFCSKSFTRREHLVNHVRQHTGETPFQCGYCPKAFTRKDHLGNYC